MPVTVSMWIIGIEASTVYSVYEDLILNWCHAHLKCPILRFSPLKALFVCLARKEKLFPSTEHKQQKFFDH